MSRQHNPATGAKPVSRVAHPFILTGMHRSGTSLAASLLESAGVSLGSRMMPAAPDNPMGFFEDMDFVDFHREALAAHAFDPDGWDAVPLNSLEPDWVRRARGLVRRRGAREEWAWKDPRTVLFLSLWEKVLPRAGFIFLFRSPWDVLDSLFRRGDTAVRDRPERAAAIWRRYNELLLEFMDRHGDRSLLFDSDAVATDPIGFVDAIDSKFKAGLATPDAQLPRPELYRRRGGGRAWQTAFSLLCPDATDLFLALQERAYPLGDRAPRNIGHPSRNEAANAFFAEWCAARAGSAEDGTRSLTASTAVGLAPERSEEETGSLARIRLFVPDQGTHPESRSLSCLVPADGSVQRVVFGFSFDASAALRITFGDTFSLITVKHIAFGARRGASATSCAWTEGEIASLPARTIDALPLETDTEPRLEFAVTGSRSQLHLDVPGDMLQPGRCRLEMTLAVRELGSARQSPLLARLVRRLDQEAGLLRERNALLDEQLVALRAEASAHARAAADQAIALEAAKVEIQALTAAHDESQLRARATAAAHEKRQDQMAADLAATRSQCARLSDRLVASQRLTERMQSTLSWRLTAPLRRLPRVGFRPSRPSNGPSLTQRPSSTAEVSLPLKPAQLRETEDARGWHGSTPVGYAEWTKRYDSFEDADVARIKGGCTQLERQSVVVVLLTSIADAAVRRVVDSVCGQWFEQWELHLVPTTAHPDRGSLANLSTVDRRIRVWDFPPPSISHLLDATGATMVAFLSNDTVLRPHALYLLARAVSEVSGVGVVYGDDDHLDATGQRTNPQFKGAWDLDWYLSSDLVLGFRAFSARHIRALHSDERPIDHTTPDSLTLGLTTRVPPAGVAHVPHVLSHRLVQDLPAADQLHDRVERVKAALGHSSGIVVEPEHVPFPRLRISYALPEAPPRVSVIIPTRDMLPLLRRSVQGVLEKTDYPDLELIVVDNQSQEPDTIAYLDELRQAPRVRVISYPAPFNFSAMNNLAFRQATGQVLLLLNNDIEVIDAGWLRVLVAHALRRDVGAVGAALYYPGDTTQHCGVVLGLGGVAGHHHTRLPRATVGYLGLTHVTREVCAVTAACMCLRREVYSAVAGMNEALAVAFNDVDLCLEIRRRGWRIVWTPDAYLYHHESQTRGSGRIPGQEERFGGEVSIMRQKWGAVLEQDPFYSPNLSLEIGGFSLARPPRSIRPWKIMHEERESRLRIYQDASNLQRALEVERISSARPRFETARGDTTPGVSVVILNVDSPRLLLPLLDHLRAQRAEFVSHGLTLQILVGDTGSTDPEVLRYYDAHRPEIEVLRDLEYSFSRCNNAIARLRSRCDSLLFLNNDIVFEQGTAPILQMYRLLRDAPQTGIVGLLLRFPDGTIQHAGIDFFREPARRGFCFHPHAGRAVPVTSLPRVTRVPAVTGACLLVRRAVFEDAGLMDEGYATECQDVALCLAAHRLGFEAKLLNLGNVVHLENGTRPKGEEDWTDRQRFLRKWGAYIEACLL